MVSTQKDFVFRGRRRGKKFSQPLPPRNCLATLIFSSAPYQQVHLLLSCFYLLTHHLLMTSSYLWWRKSPLLRHQRAYSWLCGIQIKHVSFHNGWKKKVRGCGDRLSPGLCSASATVSWDQRLKGLRVCNTSEGLALSVRFSRERELTGYIFRNRDLF